jgi:MFS transporter, BCD family, chlorophyll transporter
MTRDSGLGWLSILRLGVVQACLGGLVALMTSTLNRVMIVEYALAAVIPAALVGLHYAVQLSRPRWGYGSDMGGRRTPWIVGGMGALAFGAVAATDAAIIMQHAPVPGLALAIVAFVLIGGGVGASGTSLLAYLAAETAPRRRPAAAAVTWIMMVVGIVATAGIVGALLDPFSDQRLALVVTGAGIIAYGLTWLVTLGLEPKTASARATSAEPAEPKPAFSTVLREVWGEPLARQFTVFVFVAMLAYSAQDLILEPFAGLLFGMTPGQSTQLAGMQHAGVLVGMILVGAIGAMTGGHKGGWMRGWTVAGCIGSGAALGGLAIASGVGAGWPLALNVMALGFFNGVFAVAAIGSMMGLAGAGRASREGVRMGVWGAAQAAAFGIGGFLGAAGVDVLRHFVGVDATAFMTVFSIEAGLFIVAAILAATIGRASTDNVRVPALPAEFSR